MHRCSALPVKGIPGTVWGLVRNAEKDQDPDEAFAEVGYLA